MKFASGERKDSSVPRRLRLCPLEPEPEPDQELDHLDDSLPLSLSRLSRVAREDPLAPMLDGFVLAGVGTAAMPVDADAGVRGITTSSSS